jgi:protein tyrosine phosphatase
MLTAETEGGQLKCHPYWSGKEYGAYKLKALSEKKVSLEPHHHRRSTTRQDSGRRRANTSAESLPPPIAAAEPPYVIVRKFTLSHSSQPFVPMREITQLHYSSWPDFGAPAQPSHLLGLVELSNSIQRASFSRSQTASPGADEPEDSPAAKPMLVHCSAGCGRTGTFCTVDSVLDMLKRQKNVHRSGVTPMDAEPSNPMEFASKGKFAENNDDDWIFNSSLDLVQKTVEDFRRQRISMVQSLRQFVLCYETVLEWVSQQQNSGRRERSGSESRAVERRSS